MKWCAAAKLSYHRTLGTIKPPSFVTEPEGNKRAEKFIRSLKETSWGRAFAKLVEFLEAFNESKRPVSAPSHSGVHCHRWQSQPWRDLVNRKSLAGVTPSPRPEQPG